MNTRVMNVEKATDAWLGIDSCNGRYRFGTTNAVQDGIILPGQTAAIHTYSQCLFRGERLFVHRSCASDFLIRMVLVGQKLAGGVNMTPVIAEPFAVDFDKLGAFALAVDKEDPKLFDGQRAVKIRVDRKALEFFGAPFPLPTLTPAELLQVDVENIGAEPCRFLAAFLGKALY